MRKVLLSAIAITVVTSSVVAGDWFVGAEIGSGTFGGSVTKSTTGASSSIDETGGMQGLTIGKFVAENIRVAGTYYRVNEGANVDITHYQVSSDYLFGDSSLQPYVGVSLGKLSFKESGLHSLNHVQDSVNMDGMTYGARVGLLWSITKTISTEIGYDYKISTAEGTSTGAVSGATYTWETDKLAGWHLGLNYKF